MLVSYSFAICCFRTLYKLVFLLIALNSIWLIYAVRSWYIFLDGTIVRDSFSLELQSAGIFANKFGVTGAKSPEMEKLDDHWIAADVSLQQFKLISSLVSLCHPVSCSFCNSVRLIDFSQPLKSLLNTVVN